MFNNKECYFKNIKDYKKEGKKEKRLQNTKKKMGMDEDMNKDWKAFISQSNLHLLEGIILLFHEYSWLHLSPFEHPSLPVLSLYSSATRLK